MSALESVCAELRATRKGIYTMGSSLEDDFAYHVFLKDIERVYLDTVFEVSRAHGLRFINISKSSFFGFGGVVDAENRRWAYESAAIDLGFTVDVPVPSAANALSLLSLRSQGVYDVVTGERIANALDDRRLRMASINRPLADGERPNLADCMVKKADEWVVVLSREYDENEGPVNEQHFLIGAEYEPEEPQTYYYPGCRERVLLGPYDDEIELTDKEDEYLEQEVLQMIRDSAPCHYRD